MVAADKTPFSPDEYDCLHDVPVFKEHALETTDADGKPIRDRYGKRELQYIVDNNNRLIEDTGDYVPIVVQHTDPDNKQFDPPVVGFAGPFKLGQFGKLDPKACIYAKNWWIRKDAADLVKRYPRRSVELWREDRYEDRFFDPISLLGAHTPRLSLGLVGYSRRNGRQVQRYSAVMPSGSNTFVPAFGDDKKRHYSIDGIGSPEPDQPGESDMPSVEEIVNALENTDVFQWARQQMAKEAGDDKGLGDDPSVTGTPDAPAVPAAPLPDAGGAPPVDPDAEPMLNNEPMDGDDEEGGKVQYSRGDRREKDRYAKIERENRELKSRLDVIERDALRTVRYSRLVELSRDHVLDADEEIEDVMGMDEKAWDKHQDRILNRYERIPHGLTIPYQRPAQVLTSTQEQAKEREIAEKARALVTETRAGGGKISYSEARDKVMAQIKTA